MTRAPGRTALILGKEDVAALESAVDVAIRAPAGDVAIRERLYILRRRLRAAKARLERGRNGRSEAAA